MSRLNILKLQRVPRMALFLGRSMLWKGWKNPVKLALTPILQLPIVGSGGHLRYDACLIDSPQKPTRGEGNVISIVRWHINIFVESVELVVFVTLSSISVFSYVQLVSSLMSSLSRNRTRKFQICSTFFFFSFFLSYFFLSFFLSFPSRITHDVYEWFTHQTNALISEIFLFLVRAACELRSMSYGPKHASWWLSYTPFCA